MENNWKWKIFIFYNCVEQKLVILTGSKSFDGFRSRQETFVQSQPLI